MGLSAMVLVLIGLSFIVSRQPNAPEGQKTPKNQAKIASNDNKIASQNENNVQIPKSLLNSPQIAFIEPADLAREIEAIETPEVNFPQDERYKNIGKKLLPPRNQESLDRLVETLKGFGDYFARPFEELTDPLGEFAAKDAEVMQQTKETFQNPSHFALGEQCGLPGAAFSYPPGSDVGATACGGTPGFGGTSCNTSPQCYFSGRCFYVCVHRRCFCIVTSCYGKCGKSSAYIWDSVTGTCGCGKSGGEEGGDGENTDADDANDVVDLESTDVLEDTEFQDADSLQDMEFDDGLDGIEKGTFTSSEFERNQNILNQAKELMGPADIKTPTLVVDQETFNQIGEESLSAADKQALGIDSGKQLSDSAAGIAANWDPGIGAVIVDGDNTAPGRYNPQVPDVVGSTIHERTHGGIYEKYGNYDGSAAHQAVFQEAKACNCGFPASSSSTNDIHIRENPAEFFAATNEAHSTNNGAFKFSNQSDQVVHDKAVNLLKNDRFAK